MTVNSKPWKEIECEEVELQEFKFWFRYPDTSPGKLEEEFILSYLSSQGAKSIDIFHFATGVDGWVNKMVTYAAISEINIPVND